jgi:prepilin peptidase CpaA
VIVAAAVTVLGLLLVAAAISDGWRMIIPNWISVAVAALFLLVAISTVEVDLWPRVGVAAATFLLGAVLFSFNWMGGGDVKLWTGLALWLGPELIGIHLVMVALLGSALGVVILATRYLRAVGTDRGWRGGLMPYGIPIAAAGLILLPKVAASLAAS